jgi:hypothetical protein
MVAREASLLPTPSVGQVLMAQMLLQNRFRERGNASGFRQIVVKSAATEDGCAFQSGNFSTDCCRIRFSFA